MPRTVAATPAQPVPMPPKLEELEEVIRPPTRTPEMLAQIRDLENKVQVLVKSRKTDISSLSLLRLTDIHLCQEITRLLVRNLRNT